MKKENNKRVSEEAVQPETVIVDEERTKNPFWPCKYGESSRNIFGIKQNTADWWKDVK